MSEKVLDATKPCVKNNVTWIFDDHAKILKITLLSILQRKKICEGLVPPIVPPGHLNARKNIMKATILSIFLRKVLEKICEGLHGTWLCSGFILTYEGPGNTAGGTRPFEIFLSEIDL